MPASLWTLRRNYNYNYNYNHNYDAIFIQGSNQSRYGIHDLRTGGTLRKSSGFVTVKV
jgi:hypothetical protein